MEKIYMEYGDGLFELAEQEGITADLRAEIRTLSGILEENPSYFLLVTSGKLSKEEQKELLSQAFEGKVHRYLYNFLCLTHDRGIFAGVRYCFSRYEERYLEKMGITRARVKSAVPLSDREKQRVKESIERRTGLKTEITFSVDRSLVAGLRVEMDGKLFDNSAKNKMREIKQLLEEAVLSDKSE